MLLRVKADADMKPVLKHDEHTMHMRHAVPPRTAAAHMGHDRHAGHSVAMFRDKFWLTLILTLPVVAFTLGLSILMKKTARSSFFKNALWSALMGGVSWSAAHHSDLISWWSPSRLLLALVPRGNPGCPHWLVVRCPASSFSKLR